VRVAVRPNNLRNSGRLDQFGAGLQRQHHNDSPSSSMQLMPPLDSDNSSEESVEDEIPEVISTAEVQEEIQEESSDEGMIDAPLRYLARSAPSGSLQHINNSQDNLRGREQYYLSGQGGTLCDSDDGDDDYDAYAGEEFERELDEDGQLMYNHDDYDLSSRYRQQLHFYDRMLAQRDQGDLDHDGDDCNEVSDDGYDDDYIPDLRSDAGDDYLSDEDQMDAQEQMATIHGQQCAQFVTSSHHRREIRELTSMAHASLRHSSESQSSSYRRHQRPMPDARRFMGMHSSYSHRHVYDGYEEQDADRLKSVAVSSSTAAPPSSWSSSWLNSGLFCASLLKKKPSDEMRGVLDDKEFVYSCLKDLPGVNPDDVRIQGVLAALRGLPTSACSLMASKSPLNAQVISTLAVQYGPGPSKPGVRE